MDFLDDNLTEIYLLGEECDFIYASTKETDKISDDVGWYTLIKPPKTKDGTVAIFNKSNGTWKVVDDFRGLIATENKTDEQVLVSYVGSIKKGFTIQSPY